MADDVAITAGTGTNIATDDCTSGHVQLMKIAYSADGVRTHATVDANGVLVNLGTNNDVTVTSLPTGLLDSFGNLVSGSVQNQIDVQFYRSDGSVGDLVTETNANGGTATETGGMATFAATTTASSQAKGVSTTSTKYTAGAEVYCIFTAAFTGTGSGTSYHRIGLYDANDGFYVGYEGGTFGVTLRKATANTQTAKASWLDPLTGGASSKFTRAGTPEAIDLTKLNVYKIRFGWVGSAPIKFEVLSPDGAWVTFHEIKQPNLAALPSIENADLPVTCDVNSGDSGAALSILTNCWCAGTTQALGQLNATLAETNYAQLVRSVITGWSTAGGGAFVNVKVTPGGAMSTESVITDGTNAVAVLAAGADDTANTVNQLVTASMSYVYDGAAWDRAPGNATDGTLVNLGTNNDVTITSGTVTSLTQMNGQAISMGTGARDAGTQRVTIATNDAVPITDNSGTLTVDAPVGTPVNVQIGNATLSVGVIDETGVSAVDALAVGGGTAHDAVDSGNPVKVGGVAVSGSATPTSVAAADRTRWIFNQHGIPYVMGGHPNLITREYDFGTAAQTDVNLAAAVVAADERIYVTRFEATCDSTNTVAVSVRAGFGTASVPTASATGVSGMIASHPGIAAGSGLVSGNGAGVIAVGGAGEEPRITTSAATTGNLHVVISYYLIDETP